jgi:hypothetical protein
LGWLAGSLHCLTQQQPVSFFLDKIFNARKVKLQTMNGRSYQIE